MRIVHKECGGEVTEDFDSEPYVYEETEVPVLRCLKCGEEITGDSDVEFVPENERDRLALEGLPRGLSL